MSGISKVNQGEIRQLCVIFVSAQLMKGLEQKGIVVLNLLKALKVSTRTNKIKTSRIKDLALSDNAKSLFLFVAKPAIILV